jgi:hypothetical protein
MFSYGQKSTKNLSKMGGWASVTASVGVSVGGGFVTR